MNSCEKREKERKKLKLAGFKKLEKVFGAIPPPPPPTSFFFFIFLARCCRWLRLFGLGFGSQLSKVNERRMLPIKKWGNFVVVVAVIVNVAVVVVVVTNIYR